MLIKLLLTVFAIPIGAAIVTAVLVLIDRRNSRVAEYDDNSYH